MSDKSQKKRDAGLEWQVLGDNSTPLPPAPEPEEPKRRPWLPWLLVIVAALLLVGGASAGTLVWRARQQQERLRADLLTVVEAETQAQAFGLVEQVERLVDPRAPAVWREEYAALFDEETERIPAWLYPGIQPTWHPPSVRPQVRAVTLEEGGQRAVAEVVWVDRSEVVERRAYRLVRGAWRRTPLRAEADSDAPWRERRTEHYLLRARPEDYDLAGEDADLLAELELLRGHIEETWPQATLDTLPPTTTLTLRPQEFASSVPSFDHPFLTVNTPDLALRDPASPLSMATQRRLAIAILVTQSLVLETDVSDLWTDEAQGFLGYLYFIYLLPEAEAHLQILDEAEQQALAQAWREALEGQWENPLEPLASDTKEDPEERRILFWIVSMRLFIARLLAEGHLENPGYLARALLEQPDRPLAETLSAVTGLERPALEALARDAAGVAAEEAP